MGSSFAHRTIIALIIAKPEPFARLVRALHREPRENGHSPIRRA